MVWISFTSFGDMTIQLNPTNLWTQIKPFSTWISATTHWRDHLEYPITIPIFIRHDLVSWASNTSQLIGTLCQSVKGSQTHMRLMGWLLVKAKGIFSWQVPIWFRFNSLIFLKCFRSQISLLTLWIIVFPCATYSQSWLVVYVYLYLISNPHGLFPIHFPSQFLSYKYQDSHMYIL